MTRDNMRAWDTVEGEQRDHERLLNTYYMPDVTLTLGINLGNKCCPLIYLKMLVCSRSCSLLLFLEFRLNNVSAFWKMISARSNLLPGWWFCMTMSGSGLHVPPHLARAPWLRASVPCPLELPPCQGAPAHLSILSQWRLIWDRWGSLRSVCGGPWII